MGLYNKDIDKCSKKSFLLSHVEWQYSKVGCESVEEEFAIEV